MRFKFSTKTESPESVQLAIRGVRERLKTNVKGLISLSCKYFLTSPSSRTVSECNSPRFKSEPMA